MTDCAAYSRTIKPCLIGSSQRLPLKTDLGLLCWKSGFVWSVLGDPEELSVFVTAFTLGYGCAEFLGTWFKRGALQGIRRPSLCCSRGWKELWSSQPTAEQQALPRGRQRALCGVPKVQPGRGIAGCAQTVGMLWGTAKLEGREEKGNNLGWLARLVLLSIFIPWAYQRSFNSHSGLTFLCFVRLRVWWIYMQPDENAIWGEIESLFD